MGYRRGAKEKARRRVWHRWSNGLQRDPEILGGTPCFPGTRLSVALVGGMLLRGPSAERELRADYPYLTEQDLAGARRFAQRAGRPLNHHQTYRLTVCWHNVLTILSDVGGPMLQQQVPIKVEHRLDGLFDGLRPSPRGPDFSVRGGVKPDQRGGRRFR